MPDRPADETKRQQDIDRRQALVALGAFGSATLLACGSSKSMGPGVGGVSGGTGGSGGVGGAGATAGASGSGGQGGAGVVASCNEIPDETAGPYPDTKGMIGDPAFHRSDIREGKVGVGLTLALTLVDAAVGCSPIAGAQVEIWHCDVNGVYSEYANSMNAGSAETTYLRGVQVSDVAGKVTFRTIYPGWYAPRATHVHVQIYQGTVLKKTTQLGFPDATNTIVYTPASLITSLYTKGQNPTTNDTDQVFGNGAGTGTDGGGHTFQIVSITGDTTNGFVATIAVAVSDYAG